jgi:hypothetical protein
VYGDVLIIRSMKILSAQLVRMNVRESMHWPPGMTLPLASKVSSAGRAQAYRTGLHWSMLTRNVLIV